MHSPHNTNFVTSIVSTRNNSAAYKVPANSARGRNRIKTDEQLRGAGLECMPMHAPYKGGRGKG